MVVSILRGADWISRATSTGQDGTGHANALRSVGRWMYVIAPKSLTA